MTRPLTLCLFLSLLAPRAETHAPLASEPAGHLGGTAEAGCQEDLKDVVMYYGAPMTATFLLQTLENFTRPSLHGVNWLHPRPMHAGQKADLDHPAGPSLCDIHLHALHVVQTEPTTPLQAAAYSVALEATFTNPKSVELCRNTLESLGDSLDKHNGDLEVSWEGLVEDAEAKSLYVENWTVDLRPRGSRIGPGPPKDVIEALQERSERAGVSADTLEMEQLEDESADSESKSMRPRFRIRHQKPGLTIMEIGDLLRAIGGGKRGYWISEIHVTPAPKTESVDGESETDEPLWSFETIVEFTMAKGWR